MRCLKTQAALKVAGMFSGIPGSRGQSFLLGYFTNSLPHWGTPTPKDQSASWLSNDIVTTEPGVWEPGARGARQNIGKFFGFIFKQRRNWGGS